jgi:putative salt-induced outer membrane protein YdiY
MPAMILPAPLPPFVAAFDANRPRWTGAAALNLNLIESVSDSESLTFSARGELPSERDRLAINALYAFSRQSSPGVRQITEDRYRLNAQYDQKIQDLYFWYVSSRLDRDKIVQLNLRTILAGGLGYRVFRRDDTRWLLSGGVSYRKEDYQVGADGEEYGLRFGSEFRRKLNTWITVSHDLEFIPAFKDFDDYVLSSDLRILTLLNSRMTAEMRFIFDYDSTPGSNQRRDTNKYFVGLGYSF